MSLLTLLLALIAASSGSIHGRVLDSNGRPLVGVLVRASAASESDGRHVLLQSAASAITDSNGTYSLVGLGADRYYVSAHPASFGAAVSVYYPATLKPWKARGIQVKEGQDVSRIDIVVEPTLGT